MAAQITNALSLAGQVAIVTGGSRGIGRVIAETFLAAGCEVAICGRNAPASSPMANGRSASFHACDVRKADQAAALVDAVAEKHGRLDIVVNNAGGSPPADAATASPRFSEAIVALNLLAPLHVAQAARRWMARQESGGSIINIASVAGRRPSPGTAIYGAAKAGLISLTESLAHEWGPTIRVNAIIAGLIDADPGQTAETYGSIETQRAIADAIPMKRMGRGEDIAAAALYLASPLASFVSGAALAVHGGGEALLSLDIMKRKVVDPLAR